MKSLTVKVITISSQLLVAFLFFTFLFYGNGNDNNMTISNNNFEKMADKTLILFKKEEFIVNSVNNDIVVPLDDDSTIIEEVEKVTEVLDDSYVETKENESDSIDLSSNLFYDREVLRTEVGNLTGYGPDCKGCSGITSTGHNLYDSIYYDDNEYGSVRILAADGVFPFYSIFRVSGISGMDPFIAIVLDRGSTVGIENCRSPLGCLTMFDLAFATESDPNIIGKTSGVTFELLRNGK